MKKYTKQQLQDKWDGYLIRGWEREWKLAGVAFQFVKEVAPILEKLEDFKRVKVYITSLKLDRCMERVDGEMCFHGHSTARAFVDFHSRQLTNFLYSDAHSNADILKSIACFKWREVNRTKVYTSQHLRKKKVQRDSKGKPVGKQLMIKAKARDKTHDWRTVK